MLKNAFQKFGSYVAVLPVLLLPLSVSAAIDNTLLTNTGTGVAKGIGTQNTSKGLPEIIGGLISFLLSVLGIILVVYIIQAGILYMTAAGDATKVDKAKKMMTQAIVGIIIIVAAYSISNFVITSISTATTT